jgi:hypothetical protein
MNSSLLKRVAFAVAAAALAGCSGGSGSSTPSSGQSSLSVAMFDAPFATSGYTVTQVNLGIDKVEVVGAGAPSAFTTYATPNVINILNYTSPQNGVVFSGTIPSGSYQQLRLLLDTASTTVSGTDPTGAPFTAPLKVPSATSGAFGSATTDGGDGQGTAGVKVNVDLNAQSGSIYAFQLDFNAAHSIVFNQGQGWILKPVLVATASALAGSLSGKVANATGGAVANAEVDALQNGTIVNSTLTAADGTFTINALPPGSYTLQIQNSSATTGETNVATTLVTVSGTFAVTSSTTTNVGTLTD